MSLIVPRTCTEIDAADEDQFRERDSRPLASYRDVPAYVLLGDPGAGKTTAFRTECEAFGAEALSITARDFATFDPDDHPEWRNKILFIDGLDEVRVGAVDARTPFDEIRLRLDKLGRPRFRLSCRHADWLGPNDRTHLESVVPHGSAVKVLSLDPLGSHDVARLLHTRSTIRDPEEFIHQARETGISGLLENPQTLLLLAEVMDREEAWPTSRLDLFDKACAMAIKETNEEHSIALDPKPTSELLDAAGRLCAVLLVSGAVGYARVGRDGCSDYLEPAECGYPHQELLERALSTKSFMADHEGRFIPVHRHIAEFLAAKHLCRAIDDGLPARRVIALLASVDGITATGLRGLSAWLAAMCTRARPELIERDPIGVACYGDVHGFARAERERLLRNLSREAHQIHSVAWTQKTAGALATADMEPVLRSVLESRSDVPPMLLEFVLAALKWGTPLPGIADHLLQIARERPRRSQFQRMALESFIHNRIDGDAMVRELLQILEDISADRVPDSEGKLTTVALRRLYPDSICASSIWGYLKAMRRRPVVYRSFWRSLLVDRSTDAGIANLLDDLAAGPELKHLLVSRRLQDVPSELLARGIEIWGEKIDNKRLVDWLIAGWVPGCHRLSHGTARRAGVWLAGKYRVIGAANESHEADRRIGAWLQEQPEIQRAVVEEYVNRCHGTPAAPGIDDLLHGSPLPPDFRIWCLARAEQTTDRRVAKFFLREARDRGVSIEVLWKRTIDNPLLHDVTSDLLVCNLPPGYFDDLRERKSYLEESQTRRRKFVALVRSNVDALHNNRCGVQLLHELAQGYFGLFSDIQEEDSNSPLNDLLDNDTALIDAVLTGFRGTPFRKDIPEAHEVIRLLKSGQEYLVALPYLAGIDELGNLQRLTARRLRQALALHYCTSVEDPRNRECRLLETDPEIGAEMLTKCVGAKMRNGMFDYVAARLATDDWRSVARRVVLPLLRSVPLRAALPVAMATLDDLLIAAFRFADRAALLALVTRKLSRSSMSPTQRVHWLVAEVVGASETCPDRLQAFVQGHENRGVQLVEFLFVAGSLLDELPSRTLACFITLVGPFARVLGSAMTPLRGTEYKATRSVEKMIRSLAERPDRETDGQLEWLATNPAMAQWREIVTMTLDRRRVIRGDAAYRPPTAEQVCQTLSDGPPANAEDLAALLIDRLLELARGIRDGNTDDWRQYWNVDQYGRPLQPRPENVCRDALLSDLNRLLPGNVTARREGSYADDNRADIVVGCGGVEVPVEIKRNGHRDLWSAAHDQLIAKYARAPATGGYGIYLVFWFGQDDTQPPPIGPPPAGPRELQERAEGSLSDAERRKVSVVVLDVSRPV